MLLAFQLSCHRLGLCLCALVPLPQTALNELQPDLHLGSYLGQIRLGEQLIQKLILGEHMLLMFPHLILVVKVTF